jgi:hypothetical protein
MTEIVRNRDVVIFIAGDRQTVIVDQAMVDLGWPGGQGVQWVSSSLQYNVVTFSTGLYGGFMLWGSDESADQYTSMTNQPTTYKYGVMMSGRALMSTSTYEQYTYASRTGGGPLVPIVYHCGDLVYFSKRGFFTNEDELTITHDPLAPGFFVGFVAQIPKVLNSYYLGLQTSI